MDVARHHREAIEKCDSRNAQVLRANPDALLAELAKDRVGCLREGKNIPSGKVVDGADKRLMPLGEFLWLVPVHVDVRQSALQLLFNSD
jgi:hypothetical protein